MIDLSVRTIRYAVRTRAQRRVAVDAIIKQLEMIREAEIDNVENMPANLRNSIDSLVCEMAIDSIDWAIDYLIRSYKKENGSVNYMKFHIDDF
jgi:hypothetical protein